MKVIVTEQLRDQTLTGSMAEFKHSVYLNGTADEHPAMVVAEPGYSLVAVHLCPDDADDLPPDTKQPSYADDVLEALSGQGLDHPLFNGASTVMHRRGLKILLADGRDILLQAWENAE